MPMSILIVDDGAEDAAVIRATLFTAGAAEGQAFRFRQCGKGEEGLCPAASCSTIFSPTSKIRGATSGVIPVPVSETASIM